MPMPSYASVDDYLAAQSADAQRALQRLRALIKKTRPKLVESISYKVPTYALDGKPVVFFAAWKAHYSLYPATAAVFAAIPALLPFKHAKDTLRFDYAATVPSELVAKLVSVRVGEVSGSAAPPGKGAAKRRKA